MSRRTLAALLLTVAASTSTAFGQHEGPTASDSATADAPSLYPELGEYGREVTTASRLAQRYFDQGLVLRYSFGRTQAAAAFREARRIDPSCALCWFGEAWALGPYQNGPMNDEAGRRAYAAVQEALRISDRATPVERALIAALAERYAPDPARADRGALDRAYAQALREVVARFPDDLDVATLYAESLMLLRPWKLYDADGEPYPETSEAVSILDRVLERDLRHPGACHLYIHAVEGSSAPGRAEACADALQSVVPGVSHMQHMPSHIYARVGRYGDGVRANQLAWMVDQRAAQGGVPVYPSHNLEMLAFMAAFDGQSAVSLRAGRDAAALSPSRPIFLDQSLVRFGRWDEILDLDDAPASPLGRAVRAFSRGIARLHRGEVDAARLELEAVAAARAEADTVPRPLFGYVEAELVALTEAMLGAEIDIATGRTEPALAALREAIRLYDGLPYAEPERWILPPHHVLGELLLSIGRAAEAERVFRAELAHHPDNGWSLVGLARSLEAQERAAEAAAVREGFRTAWARADVWIDRAWPLPRGAERMADGS